MGTIPLEDFWAVGHTDPKGDKSKYGNDIALIGEKNEKITYKRLVSESDKIKKNIKKNSLVLLICKNSVESIIGYVSFLKNDHITILADANFDKKYLTFNFIGWNNILSYSRKCGT